MKKIVELASKIVFKLLLNFNYAIIIYYLYNGNIFCNIFKTMLSFVKGIVSFKLDFLEISNFSDLENYKVFLYIMATYNELLNSVKKVLVLLIHIKFTIKEISIFIYQSE